MNNAQSVLDALQSCAGRLAGSACSGSTASQPALSHANMLRHAHTRCTPQLGLATPPSLPPAAVKRDPLLPAKKQPVVCRRPQSKPVSARATSNTTQTDSPLHNLPRATGMPRMCPAPGLHTARCASQPACTQQASKPPDSSSTFQTSAVMHRHLASLAPSKVPVWHTPSGRSAGLHNTRTCSAATWPSAAGCLRQHQQRRRCPLRSSLC